MWVWSPFPLYILCQCLKYDFNRKVFLRNYYTINNLTLIYSLLSHCSHVNYKNTFLMQKVHSKNGNQISSFEILSCFKTIYAFNLVWSLREEQVRMWSPQKRTRSKDNVWASPCLVISYYKSWEELCMWETAKNMPKTIGAGYAKTFQA